jgi:hypothetical protein
MVTGNVMPRCRLLAGNAPMPAGNYDLASVGYEEREFTMAGEAQSFALAGERTTDGKWTAVPAGHAPYVTRIVVRTPVDPARFSGAVVVEWNNVSGGVDAGPDWMFFHRYLISSGHAWVGITAQKAGIDGGGLVDGPHLKLLDPERYQSLRHPGDAWSFDIFSQAGRLLRSSGEGTPLAGLVPSQLIAAGESQSASFLVTYINAVDPQAQVFDGFFVHGRPGTAASIEGAFVRGGGDVVETARTMMHGGERIRDDARVPVVVLQSETDVVLLGGSTAAQPDGRNLRLWEIAGAAHADTYLLVASLDDDGRLPAERMADLLKPTTHLLFGETDRPINAGPQQHYMGQAALDHLVRWAGGGSPPPAAARLNVDVAGGSGGLVVDNHGNAVGGIRSPWVEVPTSQLSGLGQSGETFAVLFGTTEPFAAGKLAALYPGGRAQYLDAFSAALDATIAGGFILAGDRPEILAVAAASCPIR